MHVRPCRFHSCLFPDCARDRLKQCSSCVVQRSGGRIVADLYGDCIQVFNSYAGLEALTGGGQGLPFLIGGVHVLVVIALVLLSFGICDRLREEARAMKVGVWVEGVGAEGIDQAGVDMRGARGCFRTTAPFLGSPAHYRWDVGDGTW